MHNLAFKGGQQLLQDRKCICSGSAGNKQIHDIITNFQSTMVLSILHSFSHQLANVDDLCHFHCLPDRLEKRRHLANPGYYPYNANVLFMVGFALIIW